MGHYRIREELGRGGMGIVYRAVDTHLERSVALKLLPHDVTADPQGLERFEREAKLLAALSHPHIATIHSLEESGGRRFFTMELISGESLADRLDRGAMPLDAGLSLCRQIAHALEAAHRKGVIHRDLKPANIMVTPEEQVKLLDFGLAKAIAPEPLPPAGGATQAGVILGTPGYISPEQLKDADVDQRADIWAFGCIVYECLAGCRAFPGTTAVDSFSSTLEREPVWESLPEETPGGVRALLRRCLEKNPEKRFPTLVAARAALEEEIARRSLPSRGRPDRGEETDTANNLPIPLTSFIGREEMLQELRNLLGDHRLVTLTGVGGCGKTRLSIEVGWKALGDHPDGVWLVELASLAQPELVPRAVAKVLGLREEPNRPPAETLIEHLKSKASLLLLDNCEHLLGACAGLTDTLLGACSRLRIVASSREALGIAGEMIRQVHSLALPDAKAEPRLEEVLEAAAARLFVDRAQAVRSGFALTEENVSAVVEICRRLDGIPLALELAAARVKAMTPDDIAARLGDRFRLLTGGSKAVQPRQQTLRALIDWSYDHLDEPERALLRRLSLFAGGWTLEAAEAVCADADDGADASADDGIEPWQVLELLARLVEKSMVEVDLECGERAGRTRYRFLETVRQYARERLLEEGDVLRLRERHLRYFLRLAEEASPHLDGPEQATWLPRLEVEFPDLRAALHGALDEGSDANLGLRLATTLGRFWEVCGHWSEGRDLFLRLLARPANGERDLLRSRALNGAGILSQHLGEYPKARSILEESLAISRELAHSVRIATCLNNLGNTALEQGALERARDLYEESLAEHRGGGEAGGVALALNNLGGGEEQRGDYAKASKHHEESLRIRRELGDRREIATSLRCLGVALGDHGEQERARPLFEESLTIFRELGDQHGIAWCLSGLGLLAEEQQDFERARSLYEESLEIMRKLGGQRGIAASLVGLGSVSTGQGDEAAASAFYEEALSIDRRTGNRMLEASRLAGLGALAVQQGAWKEARARFEESLAIRREIEDLLGISKSLNSFSMLMAAQGRARQAAVLLAAAVRLREEINVPISPPQQRDIDTEMAASRAALGEKDFEAAWAEGRALSMEEAIGLALEELGPADGPP
ncbi:MAG: tetratricopeptide repeat protein [Planctomycetota bacterium]